MQLSEYVSFDGVGLAELVSRGDVAPGEPAEAALAAIAAVDPSINAVLESWPAEPVGDVETPAGAASLAHVPFLVKDIGVAMAGRRVELGSRLAVGTVSAADSHLVRRFRRAGLVTLGRTAIPELALSTTTESVLHGPTRNPWDLDRSAGGSSGGAAAAVAAGIVPLAHATDAAGSIRIPAAYTGLFGLKPTRARTSFGPGADEVLNGLAVQGGISRSVRDSAALLDHMRGSEPGDPYSAADPERPYSAEVGRDPGVLRIGVLPQAWGGQRTISPVVGAVVGAARLAESLGHRVQEVAVDLGASWEEFLLANARISTANLVPLVDALAATTGRPIDSSTLEPATLASYAYGRGVSAVQLLDALAVRNRVTRSLGAWFAGFDVLLTPTLPELPLPLGSYRDGEESLDGFGWLGRLFDRSPFTAAFNVAGTPAMSVPLASDPTTGLPIGLQFAAGHGREDVLFRLAGQLEQAAPWAHRTPPVWAGSTAPVTA